MRQAIRYRNERQYLKEYRLYTRDGWTLLHAERHADGTISVAWQYGEDTVPYYTPAPPTAPAYAPPRSDATFWGIIGTIVYMIARLIGLVLASVFIGAMIGLIVGLFRGQIVHDMAAGAYFSFYLSAIMFAFGLISVFFKAMRGGYRRGNM